VSPARGKLPGHVDGDLVVAQNDAANCGVDSGRAAGNAGSFPDAKAPDVVHDVPDLGFGQASLESGHVEIWADPVANHDEDQAVGRSVVPDIVSQVRWLRAVGRGSGGQFAIPVARRAVTQRTDFGVALCASGQRLGRARDGVAEIRGVGILL